MHLQQPTYPKPQQLWLEALNNCLKMSAFSFLSFRSPVCSITLHQAEECKGLAFTWQKQELRKYATDKYSKHSYIRIVFPTDVLPFCSFMHGVWLFTLDAIAVIEHNRSAEQWIGLFSCSVSREAAAHSSVHRLSDGKPPGQVYHIHGHTKTFTPMGNLEFPFHSSCMCFHCRRKQTHLDETTKQNVQGSLNTNYKKINKKKQ